MTSAPASKAGAPSATATDGDAAPEQKTSDSGFLGRHRRAVVGALGAVLVAGFVYYVVPQIAGLGPTLQRLRGGDPWWLALGVLLEAISYFGEIALFRGVFSRPGRTMGWHTSAQITLAGGAATKILATAGAGGIALTVWALRECGLPAAEVAGGMVCYEILTYGVYMAALAIGGRRGTRDRRGRGRSTRSQEEGSQGTARRAAQETEGRSRREARGPEGEAAGPQAGGWRHFVR